MNRMINLRRLIDILMTAALFIQMAYFYTAQGLHEWTGLILLFLFIIHLGLNRRWLSQLFSARRNAMKILRNTVNLLLILTMILVFVSGLGMSFVVLPDWGAELDSALLRKLHMMSTYSFFILISVHVGLHWGVISGIKTKKRRLGRLKNEITMKVMSASVAFYGFYALLKHDLLSYILLRKSYVYFNFDQHIVIFLIEYSAIMGLWIAIGHYLSKSLRKG